MKDKVLYYFKEISKIPRETYHVERVVDYLKEFAIKHNLDYYLDDYNNIIIKKESSKGKENIPAVILQAHTDMVCQKREESNHDFSKDPIKIIEEDGFLRADKTTLGADDGIGMAMILAILDSNLPLGKIEALFTADEEVGMDGANNINPNLLQAEYLINLDSEEEGILTAGCAGGLLLEVLLPIKRKAKKGLIKTITISNLKGGHSGVDIDKNVVNAITFAGKVFSNKDCDLIEINGGKVDNAIPDNITIKLITNNNYDINKLINKIKTKLKENNEENAQVNLLEEEGTSQIIVNSKDYLNYLSNISNGVISYEKDLNKIVKTSSNLGVIKTNKENIQIKHLIRSSDNNEAIEVKSNIEKEVKKLNGIVKELSSFPGWAYIENSKLRKLMEKVYYEKNHQELIIQTIHAGLECGILKNKIPNLDCVSIGPNIYDVHTPNEKVEIKSIERTTDYLLEVLKNISKLI